MPRQVQITVSLVSRPGVLAVLTRVLAEAGVNITAICAEHAGGRGKIRLIVSDPASARRALRKGKYRFSEEPVHVLRLRHAPGALARVAGKLGRARVNIRSVYATTAGRGSATVVMSLGTSARARKVMGR